MRALRRDSLPPVPRTLLCLSPRIISADRWLVNFSVPRSRSFPSPRVLPSLYVPEPPYSYVGASNDRASLRDTALRSDLAYTYSWGNKLAADLPGNGTTREEWKVGTRRMSALNRHRRGSRPLGKRSSTPFRLFRHSRAFTGWPDYVLFHGHLSEETRD